ncbi:MAG: hypothetical protein U1F18_08310 [Steroidobacteraceae bacterium]
MPELVSDQTGLLARPGDPADLADAIEGLYDLDREAMGRAARERVLRQFTWTEVFTHQLERYATLVRRRAGASPATTTAAAGSAAQAELHQLEHGQPTLALADGDGGHPATSAGTRAPSR